MDKLRPYLTAALLCEKVLEEKNGTLSIIHIADRLSYQSVGLPPGMKPTVMMSGLVCLKSGPVVGDHALKIVMETSSGKRKDVFSLPIKLLGKDHGQNVVVNMVLAIEEDGLYWFDVLFDGEVLTRIPLIVVQEPVLIPEQPKI